MNTIRFVVAWILCGVSVLCVGWIIGLNDNPVPNEVILKRVLAVIFFLILAALFFALAEYFRKSVKWLPQTPDQRPIVRVWTHNGTTRVVPELDWRLWWKLYERDVSFGIKGKGLRPNPALVILFTDLQTDFKTGDMNDCEAFLAGCHVEKSELFVTKYNSLSENLETSWKLVHGPNAKPPATS